MKDQKCLICKTDAHLSAHATRAGSDATAGGGLVVCARASAQARASHACAGTGRARAGARAGVGVQPRDSLLHLDEHRQQRSATPTSPTLSTCHLHSQIGQILALLLQSQKLETTKQLQVSLQQAPIRGYSKGNVHSARLMPSWSTN